MASIISAGTTSGTSLNLSGDTSGVLQLATNGSTTAITITTAQNVGIGTASPSCRLDLNRGSAGLLANFTDGVNTNFQIGTTSLLATIGPSAGSTAMAFKTGDTERMRIDSSGRVGIGTSSPAFPLDIASATGVTRVTSTTGTNAVYSYLTNTGGDFYIGRDNSAGSAFTSSAYASVLYSVGAYPMVFFTNATERMRITSGGNVAIATSSSQSGLEIYRANSTTGSLTDASLMLSTTATTGRKVNIGFGLGAGVANTCAAVIGYDVTNGAGAGLGDIFFSTRNTTADSTPTERMRITSAGDVIVAKTTTADTTVGATMQNSGRIAGTMAASTNATDTMTVYSTGAGLYRFYLGMGGTIYATSTTITGISDQRLKENIVDLPDGLDAVMALKPRKFDWKEGKGKNIKGDRGFIAQEFETVFPDMIETWKDPAPEGEEPYKGVNPNLIPTLVKAIQELKAELDTTKAEVAALKGVN